MSNLWTVEIIGSILLWSVIIILNYILLKIGLKRIKAGNVGLTLSRWSAHRVYDFASPGVAEEVVSLPHGYSCQGEPAVYGR